MDEPEPEETKACPDCAEKIPAGSMSCRLCGWTVAQSKKRRRIGKAAGKAEDRRPCPSCGESIMRGASVCPFCAAKFGTAGKFWDPASNCRSCVGCFVLLGLLYWLMSWYVDQQVQAYRQAHPAPPATTAPVGSVESTPAKGPVAPVVSAGPATPPPGRKR